MGDSNDFNGPKETWDKRINHQNFCHKLLRYAQIQCNRAVAAAFNKEKAIVGSGRGSDCETYKLREGSFPALLVTVIKLGVT